ncbi:DUF4192 family protein [Streptomyces sp. CHD11]|uniref:DUF4192 domain-containing protein n=1 Tax=Streptomyces sp. CHD11 TaxID=2741325 RepID=UPI001BFC724E|nr:DUF4192 domain-containing protein [Streptomyces sp. CHD11]MBT3152286.1 DUF4192 family protein [Streptomyces sp. CHD11]
MTNPNETTGTPENSDIPGRGESESTGLPPRSRSAGRAGPAGIRAGGREEEGGEEKGGEEKGGEDRTPPPGGIGRTAYDSHADAQQVTLRTPAELADALPYLLGYRPEDSIVLVSLYDREGRGRFGGRARLGIPGNADDWPSAARQLTHGLVTGSERRGTRPEQMVVFLCSEPGRGETGRQVKERLEPLARTLRLECGALDIPVVEALCVSGGRFWSYCCDDEHCCPAEGTPLGLPGTSVLAAAATYAGLQVRGTLSELRTRFLPWENPTALEQVRALDAAGMALVPRILDAASRHEVATETLNLAERVMGRLAGAPPASGMLPADLRDDDLLGHDEAATLILGLQDRTTRDRAAEWMEGAEASAALRLWRALARRCVGPYGEHAAAPLTLAGWVAWSTGDELEAREAFAMALGADPDYLFARLLHQACNEGLDPESVRRCLRTEREDRGPTDPVELPMERGPGELPMETEPGDLPMGTDPDDVSTGTEPSEPEARRLPSARLDPGRPADGMDHHRVRAPATGTGGRVPDAPAPPRRHRARVSGQSGAVRRRVCAEGSGPPSGRLPRPRTPAGSVYPRAGAADGARPGGGDRRGSRPGGAPPGPGGPGAAGRSGGPRGGAKTASQAGDEEE